VPIRSSNRRKKLSKLEEGRLKEIFVKVSKVLDGTDFQIRRVDDILSKTFDRLPFQTYGKYTYHIVVVKSKREVLSIDLTELNMIDKLLSKSKMRLASISPISANELWLFTKEVDDNQQQISKDVWKRLK
jgi:hypothetical protein